MIEGAGAGGIEQVVLGVVDVFEIDIAGNCLDALL